MSEWLTMNELLNKMQFGDNAINNHNQEVYMDGSGYLVYTANDKRMRVCKQVLKDQWRILPKYVSFNEAMQALKNGKYARIHLGDGFIHFTRYDTEPESLSFKEMLEGKWQIIE